MSRILVRFASALAVAAAFSAIAPRAGTAGPAKR